MIALPLSHVKVTWTREKREAVMPIATYAALSAEDLEHTLVEWLRPAEYLAEKRRLKRRAS